MKTNVLQVIDKVIKSSGYSNEYDLDSYDFENVQQNGGFGYAQAWVDNIDNINIDNIAHIVNIDKWVEESKFGSIQEVSCNIIMTDGSLVTWYTSYYLD